MPYPISYKCNKTIKNKQLKLLPDIKEHNCYSDTFQIKMIQERLGVWGNDLFKLCEEEHDEVFKLISCHNFIMFLSALGEKSNNLSLNVAELSNDKYKIEFLEKYKVLASQDVYEQLDNLRRINRTSSLKERSHAILNAAVSIYEIEKCYEDPCFHQGWNKIIKRSAYKYSLDDTESASQNIQSYYPLERKPVIIEPKRIQCKRTFAEAVAKQKSGITI